MLSNTNSVSVLGSTTGNIINDKAATHEEFGIPTNEANTNINDNSAAPLTKTQKKKMRQQASKEKKERAEMLKKGQAIARPQPQNAFSTTSFAIGFDDSATTTTVSVRPGLELHHENVTISPVSDTTSNANQNSASVSGHHTSDEEQQEHDLQSANSTPVRRALKPQQEMEQRVARVARDDNKLHKKVPTKKGRTPLKKTAKKDHNKQYNPLMTTILKHKNDRESCKATVEQFHSANKIQVPPRASGKTSPTSPRSSATISPVATPTASPVARTLSPPQAGSDRSTGEHFEVPAIDTSLDCFKVDDIPNVASNNSSIDNEELEELYASGPSAWCLTNVAEQPDHDTIVQSPVAMSEVFGILSDTTDTPDFDEDSAATNVTAGMPEFDGAIDGHDQVDSTMSVDVGDEQANKTEADDKVISNHCIILTNGDTFITPELVFNWKDEIEVAVVHESIELKTPNRPAMNKSASQLSFLFIPNTTEHKSALSRVEEQALIDRHVFPLRPVVAPTKPSRAGKKVAKQPTITNASHAEEHASPVIEPCVEHEDVIDETQLNDTEPSDAEDASIILVEVSSIAKQEAILLSHADCAKQDTAIIDKPNGTIREQMTDETSLPTEEAIDGFRENSEVADQNTEAVAPAIHESRGRALKGVVENDSSATIKVAVQVEPHKDVFLTSLLMMPNGPGQDNAERKLKDDLVSRHVIPYVEPLSKTWRQDKKGKKATNVAIASGVSDAEVTMSSTEMHEIDNTTSDHEITVIIDTDIAKEPNTTDDITMEHVQEHVSDLDLVEDTAPQLFSPRSRSRNPTSSVSSRCSSSASLEADVHLARNTYLGHTSLEDFINALDFKADGTTSKDEICYTFAALSSDEFKALQNRSPDVINFTLDTMVVQRRTKLGRTSLYTFLCAITFDEEEIARVSDVMKEFKMAAMGDDAPSEKVKMALMFEEQANLAISGANWRNDGPLSGFQHYSYDDPAHTPATPTSYPFVIYTPVPLLSTPCSFVVNTLSLYHQDSIPSAHRVSRAYSIMHQAPPSSCPC
jgi:hypothetical protein